MGEQSLTPLNPNLGVRPTKTFQADVVGEMITDFWEQAEQQLCLKNSSMRVYNMILWPSNDRVRPTDHLEEAVGRRMLN
jgi:hypothetical protein